MWKGRAGDHDAGGTPKKRGRATRPGAGVRGSAHGFHGIPCPQPCGVAWWLARQDAGQGTGGPPPVEIFPPPSREGIPEPAPSPILRAPARGRAASAAGTAGPPAGSTGEGLAGWSQKAV